MNPLSLIKAAPWIIAGVFAILLGVMANRYLDKRDELAIEKANFTTFVARTDELGKEAEAEKKRLDDERAENLKHVKENHEAELPKIRDEAVARYLAAHRPGRVRASSDSGAGSGSVFGDGAGIRLDDVAGKECLPDEGFIRDAAEDATKVSAWIEWCQRNGCPVKD